MIFRLLLLMGLLWASGVSAEELTRPAGLEPEIAFWRRTFGEVSSNQALVHDKRHLSLVYEVVDYPKGLSNSQRRRLHDRIRSGYRQVLLDLAAEKNTKLNAKEQRVKSLTSGMSADELRAAAERIRIQQGLADRFHAGLIRSGRWKPYIYEGLEQYGVPRELAALPHVESSFNPEAYSHVGAAGLWQFTRSTGRRFMRVDHVVDERRDPWVSSRAAARLLAYNYSILESWPLAITGYNHGVAGMRRAVKAMGTEDIETIIRQYQGRAFGFASRNFYVAFLAAVDVDQNAEAFFGEIDLDPPEQRILVNTPDYMKVETVAQTLGFSTDQLQVWNPALMAPVWEGRKFVPRGYAVSMPANRAPDSTDRLMASIPSSERFAQQVPDLSHRVRRGETLSHIALRYHTSVSELVAINGLGSRNRIRAGQEIKLPGRYPAADFSGDTYTVRRGDSLGVISARTGISQKQLMAMNDMTNPNRIFVGQNLRLSNPAGENSQSAPPPRPEPEPAPAASVAAAEPESGSAGAAVAQASATEPEPDEIPVAAEALSEDESATSTERLATANPDPSDYSVGKDATIEIQAAETLGHYAEWLDTRASVLRRLNGLSYGQPVVVGKRLRLSFEMVDRETFTGRRMDYHRSLQDAYFSRYRVTDTQVHKMRAGESLWTVNRGRDQVPVWLLRQYNPDLDMNLLRPGTRLVIPRVEAIEGQEAQNSSLAAAEPG